jgi:hypothetical protein
MAPTAGAQNHVITKSALDKAVQARVTQEQADRAVILAVLERADVRTVALKAGLSVEKAQAVVSTLQGEDLGQAAAYARQVQNELAGGASTIVISTTTIILVLLIILLVLALD